MTTKMLNKKSYIGYQGSVNLKLKIKDKIVDINQHNLGTDYLMKVFCKFLTGNYGGVGDIPQTIDLIKSYDGWATSESCLTQPISLSARQYEQLDGEWVAKMTASIRFDTLRSLISASDSADYRIALVSGYDATNIYEKYHTLAYIPVQANDLSNIQVGINLLVEWTMKLNNYEEIE